MAKSNVTTMPHYNQFAFSKSFSIYDVSAERLKKFTTQDITTMDE